MVGCGVGITVTACCATPVHPLLLVTVTVYVPDAVGPIEDVVAPLLQRYELKPGVALSNALLPWHTSNTPAITGVGFGLMVAVCDAAPVQPKLLVTVTVYTPLIVVEMDEVVAPLLHR